MKNTKTSSFGVKGRYSHDSSDFYNTKLYDDFNEADKIGYLQEEVPEEVVNKIYCKSSQNMSELPDNSVNLMITSPPYNVGKEYDNDLSLTEYKQLLYDVFDETYKKLATGGRACINIANIGRKPYIPLHSIVIEIMLNIGYLMRGEIIWDKSASGGGSCAWGSWMSASNPVLRDVHEYILVFCKDSFSKMKVREKKDTIGRDDFLSWTRSIWSFPTVSAKRIGHPAPFPIELPHRLINLYSYEDDVVLDPFCGSGTTCLAAKRNNRKYVGYDNVEEYVELAQRRISDLG
ncbi:MAG: SAM-dependent methyltransferase [Methanosphaera sp. rholeuAM270]|nr:MAG: SAM-dependent methyltransferase [Methanosphaera sp. rholeuAM270]